MFPKWPTLYSIGHRWSNRCLAKLSLQSSWYMPITKQSKSESPLQLSLYYPISNILLNLLILTNYEPRYRKDYVVTIQLQFSQDTTKVTSLYISDVERIYDEKNSMARAIIWNNRSIPRRPVRLSKNCDWNLGPNSQESCLNISFKGCFGNRLKNRDFIAISGKIQCMKEPHVAACCGQVFDGSNHVQFKQNLHPKEPMTALTNRDCNWSKGGHVGPTENHNRDLPVDSVSEIT